jgi:hypothetical protein
MSDALKVVTRSSNSRQDHISNAGELPPLRMDEGDKGRLHIFRQSIPFP